jgi:hypothetical protein
MKVPLLDSRHRSCREEIEVDEVPAVSIDHDAEMAAFVEELRAAAYERRGAQPEGLDP